MINGEKKKTNRYKEKEKQEMSGEPMNKLQ